MASRIWMKTFFLLILGGQGFMMTKTYEDSKCFLNTKDEFKEIHVFLSVSKLINSFNIIKEYLTQKVIIKKQQ